MDIRFDPVKRMLTLDERGIDFADAGKVFDGPVFEFEDTRFAYPEPRFATYGLLGERLVAVIWTATDTGRRVISMRKANDREYARYRHRLA
ncbi:BrnT family toxin [Sphingomonas sp. PB2P19]|uniref:BrnT family toxin n=1 Tax=Sphingomonas rhamnosi TaxID=3096156 RepID=UPI002FC6886E